MALTSLELFSLYLHPAHAEPLKKPWIRRRRRQQIGNFSFPLLQNHGETLARLVSWHPHLDGKKIEVNFFWLVSMKFDLLFLRLQNTVLILCYCAGS
jgi:hypothetical protein